MKYFRHCCKVEAKNFVSCLQLLDSVKVFRRLSRTERDNRPFVLGRNCLDVLEE